MRVEDDSPLELFRQGIKSKITEKKYTTVLKQVLCKIFEDVLTGTFEERVQQLVNMGREDPRWVRDLLLNLSKRLRERTELDVEHKDYLNPDTVGNYFKPIKKLFDMNDILMPWRRIYATYPERDNVADSRGWTRDEIALMLKYARGPLDRALVLVLASSGVRAGGLNLIWEDLTPVYRMADGNLVLDPGKEDCSVACAVLRIYRGSPEKYMAFITPEAFDALQVYGRVWVKIRCHLPRPKDPIFVVQSGIHRGASLKILRDRVDRMITKAELRGAKKGKRFEVPAMNGFRRFWNKTCKETSSGDSLASLIRKEYMMGHQGLVSLDQNYFKTNLLELAKEYIKVVPDLTIEDSERLRQSNSKMSSNIQKLEKEKDEKLECLTREIGDMRQERDSMRQEIFELKKQRELPATDLLNILKKQSSSDGMSQDVLQSLTGMIQQFAAAQDNALENMQRKYDAEIAKLRKEIE